MKIIGLCLIASAAFGSAELERAAQPGLASGPRRLQEWGWGRQYSGRARNWRKDNWGGKNNKRFFGRKEENSPSWSKEEDDHGYSKPGSGVASDKDEWGSWNGSDKPGENDKEDINHWGENDGEGGDNWNKPEGDSWGDNNDKEDDNNGTLGDNDKEDGWNWGNNWVNGNDWNKPDGGQQSKPGENEWNFDNGDKPGESGWNWDDNDKEHGNWNGSIDWNKPNGGSKPGYSEWGGNNGDKPSEGGWNWNDNDKEDGNTWNSGSDWNKPDGSGGSKPGQSGWGGNDDGTPGEGGWGDSNGGKPDNDDGYTDGGKPDGNGNGNNNGGKPDGDNGGSAVNPDSFVSLFDLGSPGQFNVRVQHGGIDREFIAYVPQSYDSAQRVPLMFNFHGFGGSMNGFMVGEADMRPVADAENFILVYPQGSSEITSNSPHWNTAPTGGDNKSTADDIGFVNQLIDQLGSVYSVDSSRVYVAGYSNGGGMAYFLGCDLSQRIAGIASVASSMMDQGCNPSHPMPMISLHGTTDGVVPYNGGNGWTGASRTVDFWVNYNGAQTPAVVTTDRSSGTTIERSVYAAGRSAVSVEHYRYMNAGHVWFQNNFQGRTTGQLIWDYLSQYSLDNLSN